jgi:hypothetical protein
MFMVGWLGWLFGLFRGPDFWPHGVSLRSKALFQASSWVAFHGCSLELTNGGLQCWDSVAEG